MTEMAEAALTNLLGSMGYFHGSSQVGHTSVWVGVRLRIGWQNGSVAVLG